MTALVRILAEDLRMFLDRPFAFFGHSLGALVGYELARFLREESALQPVHLFVSGCPAPERIDRWVGLHDLSEPQLFATLRSLGGMPDTVLENPRMMSLMAPIIRADFEVCRTYAHVRGTLLTCPISAFGGREDSMTSLEEILAWKTHSRSQFQCRMLPGGHFFIRTEQRMLLDAIVHDMVMHRS